MDNDTSSAYWNERFIRHGESHGSYKAICSYGMPYLYNKYIDVIQKKAFTTPLNALNLKNKSVLDIGCGTGRWCRILAERGAQVTGIDISKQAVELARRKTNDTRVSFMVSSIASLELPPRSFDFISCVTVLQHVTNREEFEQSLSAIKRLLKPGGKLIFMEVAPTISDTRHSTKVLSVRTEAEYLEKLSKVGLELEKVLSTDVVALTQKRLIPISGKIHRRLFHLLVNMVVILTFPVDFVFAGSSLLCSSSWHKVFVYSNTQGKGFNRLQ